MTNAEARAHNATGPHIQAHRSGVLVWASDAHNVVKVQARNAPAAKHITERIEWWAKRANPYTASEWAGVGALVQHVLDEFDAAVAAQAKRRFRRAF